MSTFWRVKISYLPVGIQSEELARRFRLSADQVRVDTRQTGTSWYGWASGFPSEKAAEVFVRQWDRARIGRATIRCKASPDSSARGPERELDTDERLAQPCQNRMRCYKYDCRFDHHQGWEACRSGKDCDAFFCKANHPPDRQKPCPTGADCEEGSDCFYLHPKPGERECPDGFRCRIWKCPSWHSSRRPQECSNAGSCTKFTCPSLHPADRNVCPSEETCTDLSCQLTHPSSRPKPCEEGADCGNYYCDLLHPFDWDPCPDGATCDADSCPHRSHPKKLDENSSSPSGLKTREQRERERKEAALPIFQIQDKFCEELEKKRVLVVRAETGSGKSTQLPQYAAEYFGGLVVCTQPRVIAAISLARRVAQEFDGSRVGHSVGYRVGVTSAVGGHNRVPGTHISCMTDGAFIQESMDEHRLSKIRVLVIDEAHERSLNTDIVIGIAQLLLQKRPKDFYVVISSATIDPTRFLRFFGQDDNAALEVEGKVFPVTVENRPSSEDQIEETVVSTLQEVYDEHEGTTLVFLPGQREIERAIGLFSADLPKDCVPLPLYSNLSPDEQDRVLQFEKENNGKRMVVFTTNIAETSLTIENTRLIIDSGLAREPLFDFASRLTSMETRFISKASAEQRKGRAGRTAPGHCLRLYQWDELQREQIEPAILHSSIDLTTLQLIYLGYDPMTFPFVDQPEEKTLIESIRLLNKLNCIDFDRRVTLRGELFVKLNFDPRFSAFLVDAYLEHEPMLDLLTILVGILTASGPFFSTGKSDEERREANRSIGTSAKAFRSDLLFYASMYREWRNTGKVKPGVRECPTCHAKCITDEVCRACRASFSAMRRLNNRIMNVVENVCKVTIDTVKNPRWNLEPALTTEKSESDIIGTNLLKHFPDQVGELLSTKIVSKGGELLNSGQNVKISKTSCFYQQEENSLRFISMSINRTSSGYCYVDRLHPVEMQDD